MLLSNQALANIDRQVYFQTFAMRVFDVWVTSDSSLRDLWKRLENGVAKR